LRAKVVNMLQRIARLTGLLCVLIASAAAQAGFHVALHGGTLYGPGARGAHVLQQGSLENLIVTAPLTGTIPFANNGSTAPNVEAESLFDGPVDGLLSDGTKINENVNAAFVVTAPDYDADRSLRLLIASISEEGIAPDEKGNLTFSLNVGFDAGPSGHVIRLPVKLTTGAVVVPNSHASQHPSPQDAAGWFHAGRAVIGRLGDFDQDGFLDGVFVLAGNAPAELPVGGGDPVVIIRPFTSEIPVTALEAAFMTLNGIVKNFDTAEIKKSFDAKTEWTTLEHLRDISERLDAALTNVDQAGRDKASSSVPRTEGLGKVRHLIVTSLKSTADAARSLEGGNRSDSKRAFNLTLASIGSALTVLAELRKKP
jgi:hypothetical protein